MEINPKTLKSFIKESKLESRLQSFLDVEETSLNKLDLSKFKLLHKRILNPLLKKNKYHGIYYEVV